MDDEEWGGLRPRSTITSRSKEKVRKIMRISHNPLVRLIVKLRMAWADWRGHHGKVWDYEPGEYYMGRHKGHRDHEKRHGIK